MRKLVVLTLLVLGTTAARAENALFYLGAGVARNSVTDSTDQAGYSLPDLKNTSWKAYMSVHPLNWLAMELGYIDLGSVSGPTPPGFLRSHQRLSALGVK